jgi:hypothetical protein
VAHFRSLDFHLFAKIFWLELLLFFVQLLARVVVGSEACSGCRTPLMPMSIEGAEWCTVCASFLGAWKGAVKCLIVYCCTCTTPSSSLGLLTVWSRSSSVNSSVCSSSSSSTSCRLLSENPPVLQNYMQLSQCLISWLTDGNPLKSLTASESSRMFWKVQGFFNFYSGEFSKQRKARDEYMLNCDKM